MLSFFLSFIHSVSSCYTNIRAVQPLFKFRFSFFLPFDHSFLNQNLICYLTMTYCVRRWCQAWYRICTCWSSERKDMHQYMNNFLLEILSKLLPADLIIVISYSIIENVYKSNKSRSALQRFSLMIRQLIDVYVYKKWICLHEIRLWTTIAICHRRKIMGEQLFSLIHRCLNACVLAMIENRIIDHY